MNATAVLMARRRSLAGFTLVELSTVTAVISILASLLLSSIAKTKGKVQSLGCLNNLKQLQLAWQSYADDHEDVLPPNQWRTPEWFDGCPQGLSAASGAWVLGDTRTDKGGWGIKNGALYPYVHNEMGVYHCPADKSKLDYSRTVLRKRSYSASFYMNGNTNRFDPQVKAKTSQIEAPSTLFVYLDEHANSIDDGVFFFHSPGDAGERAEAGYAGSPKQYKGAHWMNMPADRHSQGCNLSFADGGVKHWKWRWPKKLKSPDDERDIENDLDYYDYRRLQNALPQVPGQLPLTLAASTGR